MICVWVAPPTCMSRGLRAYQGVYARTQGLTCERAMWLSGCYHPGQAPDNVREQPIPPGTAQNAGYFATSSPFLTFFTEVFCGLGAIPPRTAAALPPSGGNCATRTSKGGVRRRLCRRQAGKIALHEDPTRRRHAARRLRMAQNPHHHPNTGRWSIHNSKAQARAHGVQTRHQEREPGMTPRDAQPGPPATPRPTTDAKQIDSPCGGLSSSGVIRRYEASDEPRFSRVSTTSLTDMLISCFWG